ncbi:MAG: hypothetical protein WEA61_01320 [Anaerolineales bacterium]
MAGTFGAVLVIGFVLALLVVLNAWRASGKDAGDPMPGASFDFKESWLSTFSALLAILGTLNISSFAFDDDPSFSFVNVFFAMLVVAAPLVYKALVNSSGKETIGGFLVASGATLWATFGVIFSLGLLLNLSIQSSGQPTLATFLTMAVIVLLIPLVAAFAHRKLGALLAGQKAAGGAVYFL